MPILNGLREAAQKVSPLSDGCHTPISILSNLCEIKIPNGSLRPICHLVSLFFISVYMFIF